MLKPYSWWIFLAIAVILSLVCFNTHSDIPHSLWSALNEKLQANNVYPWSLDTGADYVLKKLSYDEFKVHEYDFTISELNTNIGGIHRKVVAINGEYPGPLIEAFEGDIIRVRVTNKLASQKTLLHFHGMAMNQTNFYDGSPTITQCGIEKGSTFTYEFRASPPGTYWYHGHWENQLIDGLVGPLIIHERSNALSENEIRECGNEQVLLLSDLYNRNSRDIMTIFQEPWIGGKVEPVPGIALAQGMQDAKMIFNKGTSIKLHIVNSASYTSFRIVLNSGDMRVVRVDGTKVIPTTVSSLLVYPAQRYTIIMTPESSQRLFKTPQLNLYETDDRENDFSIENLKASSGNLGVELVFDNDSSSDENTEDYAQIQLPGHALIEPYFRPLTNETIPNADIIQHVDLSMMRAKDGEISGAINNKIYKLYDRDSILSDLLQLFPLKQTAEYIKPLNTSLTRAKGEQAHHSHKDIRRKQQDTGLETHEFEMQEKDQRILSEFLYNSDSIEVVDFIIRNFDDGSHPIHFHGHSMWIMERGSLEDKEKGISTVYQAPLKRDVIWVRTDEWVRARVVLDNPGLWLLHCHIPWHSITGMAAIVASQLNRLNAQHAPKDWLDSCNMPSDYYTYY